MKLLILLAISLTALQAMSQKDSVAVFHRPEKVILLINDRGSNSQLQSLISDLGSSDVFVYESPEQHIQLRCGRNAEAASCTFRFNPGPGVIISPKRVYAQISPTPKLPPLISHYTWISSQADQVIIYNNAEGDLVFEGQKK